MLATIFLLLAAATEETARAAAAALQLSGEPLSYTRAITKSDVEDRPLREIAILRNTIFARAGNVFRKHWLRDYFTAQPWYQPTGLDEKKIGELDRKNAEFVAWYEANIPRADLEERRSELLAGGAPAEGPLALEISLLDTALGQSSRPEKATSPLEDPALLDKRLNVQQLADFSRRDLRLLRNTIYARRGRPFQSPILKTYFARIRWYKADPAYSDARLTKIDKENIKLVRSVEEAAGGALSDKQHDEAELNHCA